MLVNKHLTVAINFRSIFYHTMEVSVYRQLEVNDNRFTFLGELSL